MSRGEQAQPVRKTSVFSNKWARRSFCVLAGAVLSYAGGLTLESASSADLTWGGTYRVEAVRVTNPELASANTTKAYLLHHLVLTPKLVAADGLTLYSRLDVFNDPNFGINPTTGQVNSVAGDVIGAGPNRGAVSGNTPSGTTGNDSNTLSRTQTAGNVAITALYASWAQEFGQLVVGRTPVHFGLGTAFNAGNGAFDHYIDTKDLIGYKVVLGNLFLFPMIGKVNEGVLGEEDDVNDYLVHVQYENPETELALGLLYQIRVATFAGNDTPVGGDIGGAGSTRADGSKQTLMGVYASQKTGDFRIGVEADILSGDTGIRTAGGQGVGLNSFSVAGEIDWAPQESTTTAGIKLGLISGDDPGTADTYEGFVFNRNYDVGMLMFNHPLGQRDFLRTGLVRGSASNPSSVNNDIDSEGMSNAIYFAPHLQLQWKPNLSYGATLLYAMLNKEPLAGGDTAKDLGFELDLNVTYKPYDRLSWITEVGMLLPGAAWKGGSQNLENKFAYGVTTKAAISF